MQPPVHSLFLSDFCYAAGMTDRDLHIEPERKPKPRRADARTLRQAALSYLQRYQSSKANLRRVLRQRLDRALLAYGPERTAGPEDIEVILDEYETAGLIDDSRYAENMADIWFHRGESVRAISARLSRKGVSSAVIEAAVGALKQNNPAADLQAAIALVRRRRLGPLRNPDKRADYFQKDLGVLARAGFTYHLARRVLEAGDALALDDLLEEALAR